MTDDWLDFYLDNILKASGSALKHYSMQKTKDDMRQALRQAIAGLESQEPVAWKLMPRDATDVMLKAMDECSIEGYDERLYAGHAASVYMAAWDALDTQPPQRTEQEPVAYDKTEINFFVQDLYDKKMQEGKHGHYETMFHVVHQAIKRATPPQHTEQNFCPRCGKRTNDIHTCTPPQRTWVNLTNEEHMQLAEEWGCLSADWVFYAAAVERLVKEKNT